MSRLVYPARPVAAALGAILALVLLAGCAGSGGEETDTAAEPGPSPRTIDQQCRGEFAGVEAGVLEGPDGAWLHTASVGDSSTVAVLLHQTNGGGLCGFLPYAQELADRGVQAELFDLCPYGQSVCQTHQPWLEEPVSQIALVVERARAEGAERVVLVGASMGGSLAVQAAPAVQADAVVDLSGPAVFSTADFSRDAALLTMPALVAISDDDPDDVEALTEGFDTIPAETKEFVHVEAGHGYTLLEEDEVWTALADQVAGWVAGDY